MRRQFTVRPTGRGNPGWASQHGMKGAHRGLMYPTGWTVLVERERFKRAKPAPKDLADPHPEEICRHLVGRHCAGLAGRPSGEAMYQYLLAPPPSRRRKIVIDHAAYSLLGCCSPPEIMDILIRCQIPVAAIAAHVRALGVTSQPVIRLLNRLALGKVQQNS